MVGMFQDVLLGAKILGFGIAAAIGVPLIVLGVIFCLSTFC
jgi:hypothetical protein